MSGEAAKRSSLLSPQAISVQVSCGPDAFHTVAGEWEWLVRDSFTAAFSQPAWHLAAMDAFLRRDVAVITARDQGRLVGLMPLSCLRTGARGLYFNVVGPPGCGDYQPLVTDPKQPAAALLPMLKAALSHYGRRSVYWFPHIPSNDPALPALRSYFETTGMRYCEEWESAPRLRLDGADFGTVQRTWTSSHRKDIRRQRRRLAERGRVSVWLPGTIDEAQAVLEEFFQVHDEKWISQGFPGMFQNAAQRNHFHAILERLWGRSVHFSTLRCGTVNVSFHFGFFADGWMQWYRSSYRPEFAVYSPSKIHISMLIEQGCQSGWKGIDFLLGAEAYKGLWCNDQLDVVSIYAGFRRWSPAYFWFSTGRPFVRGIILEQLRRPYFRVLAWIERVRRARQLNR
jgi:CelD/BcsL family acetyltransferase involved in cellulose biosynthesis